MNRKINILSILTLCVLFFASCNKEPISGIYDPSEDGKRRIELKLNLAYSEQHVNTKSTPTEEGEIVSDRVYILVVDKIDGTGKLKQKPVKASVVDGDKIFATLNEESTQSYLYVLANVTAENSTLLESYATDKLLSEIWSELTLAPATKNGLTHPFPMYGVSEAIATIKKGSIIPGSVSLVRAVARIDLKVANTITTNNFELVSVSLANGAKKGWFVSSDPILAQSGSDVTPYTAVNTVVDNSICNQIYCYENGGKRGTFTTNPTRIIVEGRYNGATSSSYYGIDIAYAGTVAEPLLYDINRNFTYTVNITKVDKDGYSTYEEALKASTFNSGISSDIEVTDPYAHDIVSNGKQYLGTTNTALLIYSKDKTSEITNVIAATLSYTTDPGWSVGRIVASEGITFVSGMTEEPLSIGSGSTPVVREVQINVKSSFTRGTISIHIGNLSQTIVVTKKADPTPAVGGVLDDFAYSDTGRNIATTDYVVGEVISPSPSNSWLKLSSTENTLDPSGLQDNITNDAGQIFIHIGSNVDFNGTAVPREAQLYVSSRNDEQRTRVHVQQATLDVYSGGTPIRPFTYVGTFHRWNQTGERLIRIEGGQEGITLEGSWTATVVYGDFIMLTTSPSPDTGIDSQAPYGERGTAIYNTDDLIETNCQITDGQRTVHGELTPEKQNVFFRVGLTGKLDSEHSQPRYGLIAFSYNGGNVQFIYVRQGEEPDYLMRPNDPVIYTKDAADIPESVREPMPIRENAKKLAVYNLKDLSNSDGLANTGASEHGFVRYPSQGGYYYFKSGIFTISPNTTTKITIKDKNNDVPTPVESATPIFKPEWETCPKGYRRIVDGGTGLTFIEGTTGELNKGNSKATVSTSENRQSYWLFPMKKLENTNFSNQLKGFLADGYFDRRPIVESQAGAGGGGATIAHATVSPNSRDAAYWGYLVFNPYNYASVFLPLSGVFYNKYTQSEKDLEPNFKGIFGGFLTSTYPNNRNIWITNFGFINNNEVFDNYVTAGTFVGYPVRCVKAENPPILSPPVDVGDFDPSDNKLYAARVEYNTATDAAKTLETKLKEEHSEDIIKLMNSLVISGTKQLTAVDYAYLNSIAEKSADLASDYKLQHITIRGRGNKVIPVAAFTSKNWRTIAILDAMTIEDGAIDLAAGSILYNFTIGYFDTAIINSAAFGANVKTTDTNLMITGKEYEDVDKNSLTWRGKTWKSIKEYK